MTKWLHTMARVYKVALPDRYDALDIATAKREQADSDFSDEPPTHWADCACRGCVHGDVRYLEAPPRYVSRPTRVAVPRKPTVADPATAPGGVLFVEPLLHIADLPEGERLAFASWLRENGLRQDWDAALNPDRRKELYGRWKS